MDKEREILEETMDLEKSVAILLFNYHAKMKDIKSNMIDALNLMDEVAEGDEKAKEELRKKILDNYNDLPRESLELIDKLVKNLKK